MATFAVRSGSVRCGASAPFGSTMRIRHTPANWPGRCAESTSWGSLVRAQYCPSKGTREPRRPRRARPDGCGPARVRSEEARTKPGPGGAAAGRARGLRYRLGARGHRACFPVRAGLLRNVLAVDLDHQVAGFGSPRTRSLQGSSSLSRATSAPQEREDRTRRSQRRAAGALQPGETQARLSGGDVTAVAACAGLLGGCDNGDLTLAASPSVVQFRVAGRCETTGSCPGILD
jgi:hypothetical protein